MTKAYSYIRFSTHRQLNGGSLNRQLEATEKYASDNGLTLDTSIVLQDLGIPAFKGENIVNGALGEFVKLVENGNIQKGSVLIVENLDRLSRDKMSNALALFLSIINAGITIVTLMDNREYNTKTIDNGVAELIISISILSRAHEESRTKSRRIRESRKKERELARSGIRKITSKAPKWLKLNDDKTAFSFDLIVDYTIKEIFRLKIEGSGARKIQKILSENPSMYWQPPSWKRNETGGWKSSYINRILTNPAVKGEFQPHELTEEGRQPSGEPIMDYYPRIIDDETFYRVQKIIQENRKHLGNGGGRTGKANNLFVHIVKCGFCQSSMQLNDKGTGSKGGKYLKCSNNNCNAKAIRYYQFEDVVLKNLEELDISQITLEPEQSAKEINILTSGLDASKAELSIIKSKIENLTDAIAKSPDSLQREILSNKQIELIRSQNDLSRKTNQLDSELEVLKKQKYSYLEHQRQIVELNQLRDQATNDDDKIRINQKLRRALRNMIKWIRVYPLTEPYVPVSRTEDFDLITMKDKYLERVSIRFNNNQQRALFFKHINDELKYESEALKEIKKLPLTRFQKKS